MGSIFKDPNYEEVRKLIESGSKYWNAWNNSQTVRVKINTATFSNIDFSGYRFQNIDFVNVTFENCQLFEATFLDCQFFKTDFLLFNIELVNFKESLPFDKVQYPRKVIHLLNCTLNQCDIFNDHLVKFFEFDFCKFQNIDLSHANATKINFSSIEIDEETKKHAAKHNKKNGKKDKGIILGLNGIYNVENNSASLTIYSPKPDVMLGGDADVILLSLTKAKRAFNTSITSAGIVTLKRFNILPSFDYPILTKIDQSINTNYYYFLLFTLLICTVSLYKSNIFLGEVSDSVKYIKTQEGVIKVGRFPWMVSRYWGKKKIESFVIRFLYCFISMSLIWILSYYPCVLSDFSHLLIWGVFLLNGWFCYKLFSYSQKMQLPLLFDPKKNPAKVDSIDLNTNA